MDSVVGLLAGLQEVSLYGMRRLTDRGLAALSGLSVPNLRWVNLSGAYKVSDGAVHCLLASHPSLLLYNKPSLFGTPAHGVTTPGFSHLEPGEGPITVEA